MKILILGVNGFIGSNLSKRLVNKKVKIFGFDKSNFNIIGLKNNQHSALSWFFITTKTLKS